MPSESTAPRPDRRAWLGRLLALALTLAVAYFVWPTPWAYYDAAPGAKVSDYPEDRAVIAWRRHRLSGETQVLTPRRWYRAFTPEEHRALLDKEHAASAKADEVQFAALQAKSPASAEKAPPAAPAPPDASAAFDAIERRFGTKAETPAVGDPVEDFVRAAKEARQAVPRRTSLPVQGSTDAEDWDAPASPKREAVDQPLGPESAKPPAQSAVTSLAIKRAPVTSSALRSVGYDARSLTLEVEFVGGAVYRYAHVPEAEYLALLSASSIGQHFNAKIKDAGYPVSRVR